MPRQFYPGAPRDIDEAARRIHRLLEREAAARATMANVPAKAALEERDAQRALSALQVAQAGTQTGSAVQDPLAGWPASTAILDRILLRSDNQGHGAYGASRATHPHHGIDFAAPAGTTIYSPIDGTIDHMGWAYTNDAGQPDRLRSIRIAAPDGRKFKLLYVSPATGLVVGDQVSRGAMIGSVQNWQDLQDKANNKTTPAGDRVTDHVHMEIFDKRGRWVDPTPCFDEWHRQLQRRGQLQRVEDRYHR